MLIRSSGKPKNFMVSKQNEWDIISKALEKSSPMIAGDLFNLHANVRKSRIVLLQFAMLEFAE